MSRFGLLLIFTFVFQTVSAAEPKVRFVDGSDDYRSARGIHLIVNVDMRNRWNKTTRFKLNGYLEDYQANGVCLIYGNDNKCFQVDDSSSQIVNTLSRFNTRDKEGITDACTVITNDYDVLVRKTRNRNARKLLEDRKSKFQNFAKKCQWAIRSTFPGTRFAKASGSNTSKTGVTISTATNDRTRKTYNICDYEVNGNGFDKQQLKNMQAGLQKRGLYKGGLDGVFGKGSCAGLEKFMSLEARTKVFDERVYSRLVQTPSRATLSQYNSSSDERGSKFSYARTYVNTNDGRYWTNPSLNWLGVDAHFVNARLNNKRVGANDWLIEITGRYQPQQIDGFLFNSNDIFKEPIKLNIATSNNSTSRGPQYFFGKYGGPSDPAFFSSLTRDDLQTAKAACTALSDASTVKKIMDLAAKQNKFDDKHRNFWQRPQNIDETVRIAKNCLVKIASTERGNAVNTVSTVEACNQNKAIIRSNQTVLKDLGFYNSIIDGLSGPNYRRAVRSGEQLLGTRADDNVGCLNVPERQILSSIYDAGRKGSQCRSMMSVNEVKETFEQLKAAELTKKISLGYANVGGLMWMIDTVSDLEKRLSFTDFYKETKTSKRDCRLDRDEFDALAPKDPVTLSLAATTLSMTTLDTDGGTTLRLIAGGNDLETSKMSKSVFVGSNQASMDVRFATFKGNPVLDFVISEEDTKINLHLYESGMTNRNLEAQMPELFLDEQPNGWSAFYLRMFNDGSTNIKNGEFAKIVTQMPEKDKAMVAALCGQIAKVSSSSEGFAASFTATEDRDAFRRSSFSSEPVREAISSLANQCVDEIRSKGLVIASFDVEVQTPVCSATQNELLSKLDTEIDEAQTALQGFEDEIKAIQVNRPLFERDACPAYENDLTSAQEKLSAIESEIAQSITSLADLEAKLVEGEDIKDSLSKISQPSELCDVENNGLKDRVNSFIQDLNPAAIGVVCPDDTAKSPIQIVIDEINAEIIRLLEIHISPDQIAELKNTITQLEAERVEFAATVAAVSQTKASPVEIDQQMQTNAGLSDTVSEIEGQVTALETEIAELRGVMDDNASLISEIDQLNQELVSLTSQKMLTQGTLEDVKSKVLQAQATITQVEMQIDKVRSQTSDLEVQLGAASSTAGTLQQEVQTLTLEVAQTQQSIENLEQEVAVAQGLIDDANSVIASNSQAVVKLDAELNAKNATATTLKMSLDTLGPQADAAEQTVRDLEASLKADFVPVAEYKEQEARLNEMTQIVTERTKLIRELRDDLQAIQGEEQLLVKMCLADAQCKAAMGDRLGVE